MLSRTDSWQCQRWWLNLHRISVYAQQKVVRYYLVYSSALGIVRKSTQNWTIVLQDLTWISNENLLLRRLIYWDFFFFLCSSTENNLQWKQHLQVKVKSVFWKPAILEDTGCLSRILSCAIPNITTYLEVHFITFILY